MSGEEQVKIAFLELNYTEIKKFKRVLELLKQTADDLPLALEKRASLEKLARVLYSRIQRNAAIFSESLEMLRGCHLDADGDVCPKRGFKWN